MTNPNDLIPRGDALDVVYRIQHGYSDLPEDWQDAINAIPAAPVLQSDFKDVSALVDALRMAAKQHRIIAGLDLMGASSVAYNAAKDAEAAIAAWEASHDR